MASYTLLSSYSTVQVLSATVVNDVVYCTIQTDTHSVIASMPVSQVAFNNNGAAEELTALADGIETMFGRVDILSAVGVQTIDASGLLQDQVSFTVVWYPQGGQPGNVTADALVPVGLLSQSDPAIADTTLNEAEAIIMGVYNNLKSAAGG